MIQAPTALQSVALRYRAAGLVPIPNRLDRKCPALPAWTRFQSVMPTEDETREHFARPGVRIGIVCGRVSGGLEVLDFDCKGAAFDSWRELVESQAPDLTALPVIERSPSGGLHLYYRCPAVDLPGNAKLAQRKGEDGKLVVLIETRAQGGQIICAPSPGYEIIQGSLEAVPVVTPETRALFLEAAAALNEYTEPQRTLAGPSKQPSDGDGLRAGDDYNARGDVRALLEKHGWKPVQVRGENELWRRPGKSEGWSATLHREHGFYCFTSSAAGLEPGACYTPFALYAALEHAGQYGEAAKALAGQGFGRQDSKPKRAAKAAPAKPKAGGDTNARLVEHLRTFNPVYRHDGKIHFKSLGLWLAPATCYSLPGVAEIVAASPEAAEWGGRGLGGLNSCTKELAKIAALRLMFELPEERDEDTGEIFGLLVGFLISPRVFYTANGTPTNTNYAAWAVMLKPGEPWRECFGHHVYGRHESNGLIRLGVRSDFLLEKCPKLGRMFQTPDALGRVLLNRRHIEPEANTGRGTRRISCGNRVFRIFEFSRLVVDEATGTPDQGGSDHEA